MEKSYQEKLSEFDQALKRALSEEKQIEPEDTMDDSGGPWISQTSRHQLQREERVSPLEWA